MMFSPVEVELRKPKFESCLVARQSCVPRGDASVPRENSYEGSAQMVQETIQGTFRQTNLTNESPEYLAKREELRLAEIELMRQRERVAELRRHLPPGPALQDYKFIEGPVHLDSGDTPKANRPAERTVHGARQVASDLSPDVRQTSNKAVSDVHRLDRRHKRSR
jgi:Bacterial protein of unknown function (DUF899)